MSALVDSQESQATPICHSANERRRIRELLSFYHPLSTPSQLVSPQGPRRVPLPHDIVLNGLAHLGAVRTQCQRAFVALVDDQYHYTLAEVLNGGPILGGKISAQPDLLTGPSIGDITQGICPVAISVFAGERSGAHTSNLSANRTRYIVNDLTKEEALCGKRCVGQWPNMRFYAGVPIESPSGYILGAYCVMDDKPRDGLSEEDVEYLAEVAEAIVKHLEHVKIKNNFSRAERLIKGLGLFVEGNSSVREWWLEDPDNLSKSRKLTTAEKQQDLQDRADREFGAPSSPDKVPAVTAGALNQNEAEGHYFGNHSQSATRPDDSTAFVTPITSDHSRWSSPPLMTEASSETEPPDSSSCNVVPHGTNSDALSPTTTSQLTSVQLNVDDVPEGAASTIEKNRGIFSRASNLIREAVELEGTIFLDATWIEPGIGGRNSAVRANDKESESSDSLSCNSDEDLRATDKSAKEGSSKMPRARVEDSENKPCKLLGYSTRIKSSYNRNAVTSTTPNVDQATLRRFLKKYPLGTIFTFDQDGVISSSEDDSVLSLDVDEVSSSAHKHGNRRRHRGRRHDAQILFDSLPGLRSVCWFPLWDFHKERWFAGCLAWTTDPLRVLVPDDLTYFAAFGNSVMAEVSRIEAFEADRAKSNFISSISHELRSPLHGILGSAELLQDLSTGSAQDDLIRMVEICGRTLLDTTDHLLDFAKINNLTSTKKGRKALSQEQTSEGNFQNINLADLIEDVVRAVFAGHAHQNSASSLFFMTDGGPKQLQTKKSSSDFKSRSRVRGDAIREKTNSSLEKTFVIIDIDKRDSWAFKAQPGAFKRIIMNVFGNALKYTKSGTIVVSLRSQDIAQANESSPKHSRVAVSVHDTGRGMGKEYLKHRLYKPFSQENDLSVGTGLGLSIVKQIANNMGATVDLKSEMGYGTVVEVSSILEQCTLDSRPPSPFQDATFSGKQRCSGKSVCLIGFDLLPDIKQPPTGVMDVEASQLLKLKSAMSKSTHDWLGMEVSSTSLMQGVSADLFIIHESRLHILEEASPGDESERSRLMNTPTLVLCSSSTQPPELYPARFNLHHPYCFQRLAEGVKSCLDLLPAASDSTRVPPTPKIHESNHLNQAQSPNPTKLPIHPRTASSSAISSALSPSPSPSSKSSDAMRHAKILIVDDNSINVRLLAGFMKKLRYEHSTAMDGQEAVNAFKSANPPFTIVLMDISMPVMDGIAATREIRKSKLDDESLRPTIIACTGLGSESARQEAHAGGMDTFLTKPVSFKRLKEVLTDALRIDGKDSTT